MRILSAPWSLVILLAACSPEHVPGPMLLEPEFLISDGAHAGGTVGFYFLPPMVNHSAYAGAFDGDLTTMDPWVIICDVTAAVGPDCGGATPAVATFTRTSTPGISVTSGQYQVNWDTKAPGFDIGHTYRLHVSAGATGSRRELGFADVLLTSTPGQVKDLASDTLIVLQDGRTLPVKFRIETGIVGSLAVGAASLSLPTGGTDLITATARDLHGVALPGVSLQWTSSSTPNTGPISGLTPASGTTGAGGMATTTFTAGATPGSVTVTGSAVGLSADVTIAVQAPQPWTTLAPMPTPRYAHRMAAVNGILYAVGGIVNGAGVSTVEAYDPATNTWSTKAPMPTVRGSFAIAVVNGILYAISGGDCCGIVATVVAYDPSSDTWSSKAPVPFPRAEPAGGVANGAIYVIGGYNNGFKSAVESYDPITNVWTPNTLHAYMPTARYALAVGGIGNTLYAVGGEGYSGVTGALEAYDAVADSWTTLASMPTPRLALGVGVSGGLLYAIGGAPGGGGFAPAYGTFEVYDPASNSWSSRPSMLTPRYSMGVTMLNGILYTVGGRANGVTLGTVEAYRP